MHCEGARVGESALRVRESALRVRESALGVGESGRECARVHWKGAREEEVRGG